MLQEFGVVPVLYASQWFLTAFSCPFPTAFSCRVIDVMLTENCGHVMLRVGLAVIKACTDALTELHDFEDLVTYLKVGTRSDCMNHRRGKATHVSTQLLRCRFKYTSNMWHRSRFI